MTPARRSLVVLAVVAAADVTVAFSPDIPVTGDEFRWTLVDDED